jgi:hypothetical protein
MGPLKILYIAFIREINVTVGKTATLNFKNRVDVGLIKP